MGEHGHSCIWADGHAQPLLQTRGCGEVEWVPAAVRAETEKALSKSACTLKDFKLDDNMLTETMVCGTTTILQETKFHGGDSFETTMSNTNGGVTKVSQIKGRRTGNCKVGTE